MAKKKSAAKAKGRARAKEPEEAGTVRTLGEVARHFGRSVDTVRKGWRPGWPAECGKAGAWDLDQIASWKAAQEDRAPGRGDSQEPGDEWEVLRRRKRAEARIKEAEAERRERMNRLAAEEIVFRRDIESFLSEFFRMCRDLHARLAEEMASEFPSTVRAPLTRSLEDRCRQLLRSLRAQSEKLAELVDAED